MSEKEPTTAQTIEAVLAFAEGYSPEHYKTIKGRLNHVLRRYSYVAGAAVVACTVLGEVLGL